MKSGWWILPSVAASVLFMGVTAYFDLAAGVFALAAVLIVGAAVVLGGRTAAMVAAAAIAVMAAARREEKGRSLAESEADIVSGARRADRARRAVDPDRLREDDGFRRD